MCFLSRLHLRKVGSKSVFSCQGDGALVRRTEIVIVTCYTLTVWFSSWWVPAVTEPSFHYFHEHGMFDGECFIITSCLRESCTAQTTVLLSADNPYMGSLVGIVSRSIDMTTLINDTAAGLSFCRVSFSPRWKCTQWTQREWSRLLVKQQWCCSRTTGIVQRLQTADVLCSFCTIRQLRVSAYSFKWAAALGIEDIKELRTSQWFVACLSEDHTDTSVL